MSEVNWDEFLCRCSAIVKMMAASRSNPQITEKQEEWVRDYESRQKPPTDAQKLEYARLLQLRENGKKIVLSDGCIEYLMEVYAWETQRMIPINKESLDLMQLKKGKQCEGPAKILLSAVDGEMYETHKERIRNDFLSGEIDYYLGESVYKARNVTDCKNAFDYPGFLKKINNGLENGQREQVGGYGLITGAKELFIANCLVSATDEMIEDMKYRVLRKINAATTESPEFLETWSQFERSMRYDHIPPNQRVSKIKIEPFSEAEEQKIYDRVKVCREYLWNFHEMYQNLNL